MKYIIPRNKLIADPSFENILRAGPESVDKDGNPLGNPFVLYRGNDMNFPSAAKLIDGKLIHYNGGMVYLPKFASYSDMYLNFSKESLKHGVTQILAGGLESIIGELPIYLSAGVHTGIEQTLFPEKEEADLRLKKTAAELTDKGAICLPWVQLVEIEYQIFPASFFRKANHRFLYTYEQLNGERKTYGFHSFTSNSQDHIVLSAISARMLYEFGSLTESIKFEQVNGQQLWITLVDKYRALYQEKLGAHAAELLAEYQELFEQELKQKGFTDQSLHAEMLKRLAPLLPYYRQIPRYNVMVQIFELSAAGKVKELEELMKQPLKNDLS